ncbi:MAG: hypothetical protein U1E76_03570 [Planctomycetota bacterium]
MPAIRSDVSLRIGNSFGYFTQGILFVGWTPASLPTAWDGTLLVLPAFTFPVVSIPAPRADIAVIMPCGPSLIGLGIYLQAIEVDPGASRGVSFTPGLLQLVGT